MFRVKKNEEGQAMVEFALVFIIIVMLALGIAQFSMILSAQIAVTNAAREGARAASVGAQKDSTVTIVIDGNNVTLKSIEDTVKDAIGGHQYLNISNIKVEVTGDIKGQPVEVVVKDVYVQTIVPVPSFSNFGPGSANIIDANTPFNLSGTASMRLEM